ncbi:MAG: hypothetical protein D6760_00745 [Deltaproteobacteria bacterium]|nr:MAG: hypothetical protein D6760_00745 [Deltaproteobacteria bacterium]
MDGDVRSLANSDAIVGTEEGLIVEPFFGEPPATLAQAQEVRRKVFANDVFLDRLVSRDGSIAVIIVQAHDAYDPDSPYPHPVEVYRDVAELVSRTKIPGTTAYLAGSTSVEAVFGRQMEADLAHLIPLSLMVVVVVLYLCFRTGSLARLGIRAAVVFALVLGISLWGGKEVSLAATACAAVVLAMLTNRGVLLPALVVVLSVVWTWGAQAAIGLPIYMTGTIIPPLLLAIGCADGIHIIERYVDVAASGTDRRRVVVDTMLPLWRPVVLTSLTTAAGFGSLVVTRLTVYQVFGLTAAIGILSAMILSLVLLPAALSLLRLPRQQASEAGVENAGHRLAAHVETSERARPAATAGGASTARRLAPAVLDRLGRFSARAHRPITAAGALLMIALLIAASGLRVDYSWVESLAEGTPELEADRLLRTRHGGSLPLNIVVTAAEPGGVKAPAFLRAMDDALDELSKHPAVGDTRSIAEYVKRMNQAMHADRPEELRIPDDRNLVAQYLLLYSLSGDPTELDDMVDYDYHYAHAGVLLRSDWLSDMDEVVRLARDSFERRLGPLGATVTITGSAMITKVVFDLLIESQISSLATAAILVFVMLAILYRSGFDALVCMLPPMFTAVANFGGMALIGKPLGPMEAMVGAIGLGIGIDYSIHLMSSLRLRTNAGMELTEAIAETMRTTGRAILFNAVVVVAGFSVLAASETPSNAAFGLQIALNMALCCVAALLLLPAVLVGRAGRQATRAAESLPRAA